MRYPVDSLSDFVKHGPCARFAKNMVYSDLPISLFHQFYSLHCALTWHLTFAAVFKWMLVKVGRFLQELLSFQILDNPNASHTQMARKLATIGAGFYRRSIFKIRPNILIGLQKLRLRPKDRSRSRYFFHFCGNWWKFHVWRLCIWFWWTFAEFLSFM